MRLFTAIELSSGTRAAIAAAQRDAAIAWEGDGNDLRLTPPQQLHLTLVFIGHVDAAKADAILAAMRHPLAEAPFAIEFGSFGVFPPRGAPRVLWIGVTRGAAALSRVFSEVATRLEVAGVPREARPYSPHLTIGRWREAGGPRRVQLPRAAVAAVEDVRAVTLFESQLHPSGARHLPLLRTPLAGDDNTLH